MTTYPGLPGPLICDFLSREASRGRYAPGVEFQIGKIEMVANTGTYLDSPFHRYADGKDLSALPLDVAGGLDAVVVRGAGGRPRDRSRRVRGAAGRRQGGAGAHRLGRALGHPTLPRRAIPSSPPRRRSTAWPRAPRWSGSTRSTSTTSGISRGRCTRSCSRPGSRSSSTCADLGQLPDARLPLLGRAGQGRRVRHLAGARLRDRSDAFAPVPFRQTTVAGFPAIALRSERARGRRGSRRSE